MTKKIRYLSLFTGIGGFERGIETSKHKTRMECVGYSEVDKYATSIYERHYPNHTGLGDATKIQTEELPDFDLLVGGFPCQAFSHAGKRRGFNDTRGTLFFEIARILRDKKPRYFLLENVRGLLSHDKGSTFTTMLQILAKLGYDVQWQIYNSKNHGVAQNRERLYIKGFLGRGMRCPREILSLGGASTTVDARHGEDKRSIVWCRDRTGQHKFVNTNHNSLTITAGGQNSGANQLIRVDDKQLKEEKGLRDNEQNRIYHEQGVHPTLTTRNQPGVCVSKKIQKVGNNNPWGTRVAQVDSERSCPSTKEGNLYALTTSQRGTKFEKHQDNYVLIRDNTRKGYLECHRGDGITLGHYTGRDKVQPQSTATLDTSCSIGTLTDTYRIRRLTPTECEKLQGFPIGWTMYGSTGEKISDTQRYKCLGNAVTVNVVRDIMDDWNITEEVNGE